MAYSERLSFDERNRYSFSGADVAAFAFYPGLAHSDEADRLMLQQLLIDEAALEGAIMMAGGAGVVIEDSSGATQTGTQQEAYATNLRLEEVRREIQRIARKIRDSLPVHLESLATISLSIHEPRSPARALGHKAPKGFARSVRTIAGTMVLLVVEDHPLRKLAYQVEKSQYQSMDASWSLDNQMGQGTYRQPGTLTQLGGRARISTLLKPFNITLSYRTEVLPAQSVSMTHHDMDALTGDFEGNHPTGTIQNVHRTMPDATTGSTDPSAFREAADANVAGAKQNRNSARDARRDFKKDPYSAVESVKFRVPRVTTMMIEGIEIISEGITTSVNDMVTEVVIQFMAQDVKQMSSIHESGELSLAPEDLPSDIYAELRGQALAETKGIRKGTIKDMKSHERALKSELRSARADRRQVKRHDIEQIPDFAGPGNGYEPV